MEVVVERMMEMGVAGGKEGRKRKNKTGGGRRTIKNSPGEISVQENSCRTLRYLFYVENIDLRTEEVRA